MTNLIKTGDVIIAVIILILTAAFVLLPSFGSADFAVIYVDGKEYGKYNLNENNKTTVELVSDYGHNTVVIKNGQVFVEKSSCKDKLEVKAGPIKKQGQTLVCLPNRVVVTIEGGAKTDATAF
ncbi:MAG: NusG domain II-containing protein [Clostridia bacterium]|nr:NusG domain II-containing protein [Clostridia bacterium]